MSIPTIRTERLLLRPFREEDWQGVLAYMSDPAVTTFLEEGLLDEAGSRSFVAHNLGDSAQALAVTHRKSGELIGHLVFHPWFGPRTQEIGWVLGRPHQGKGYATEAARALLVYGFETLDLHRVIATCQPENVASWRVMEKLGMRREAHFHQGHYRGNGVWWDEYFYAILAGEWKSGS